MLAVRLKELRAEKKISQLQLAKLLYVSQQTIGKWETNVSTPNPETLVKIANIFDVTVDSLLGVDKKMDSSSEESISIASKEELEKIIRQLSPDEYNTLKGYATRLIDERISGNLHKQ